MQNFLILQELQTEFLKFKIHFAKISYKEFLIKNMSVHYTNTGAARGLLGSRHLVVKITDFTDFHHILTLRGFQRYLRKLGRYFTPKRPQEPPGPLIDEFYIVLIATFPRTIVLILIVCDKCIANLAINTRNLEISGDFAFGFKHDDI